MHLQISAIAWKWIALGCAASALSCVVFALVGSERGILYALWGRYTTFLTFRLRRIHVWTPGARIATMQSLALACIVALGATRLLPFWYVAALVASVAPVVAIEKMRRDRIAKMDAQADGFILALANALKTTPSLGAALDTVASLLDGPVAEEFQLVIKETRIGKSLDEALQSAGPRMGSHKLGTGLAALLIGRKVGGDLPKVLETTAATLREMERLEGVVRQKTAESRMQLWALTLAPGILCGGIYKLDPMFFRPLTDSSIGYAVCVGAGVLYILSIIVARKILAVDL